MLELPHPATRPAPVPPGNLPAGWQPSPYVAVPHRHLDFLTRPMTAAERSQVVNVGPWRQFVAPAGPRPVPAPAPVPPSRPLPPVMPPVRARLSPRPDTSNKPRPPRFGPSKARVVILRDPQDPQASSDAAILRIAARLLNRPRVNPGDLASLAGAPDWVTVQIRASSVGESISLQYVHEHVIWRGRLNTELDNRLSLHIIRVDTDPNGAGLGTAILGRTIEAARRLGVPTLDLEAARSDPDDAGEKN